MGTADTFGNDALTPTLSFSATPFAYTPAFLAAIGAKPEDLEEAILREIWCMTQLGTSAVS